MLHISFKKTHIHTTRRNNLLKLADDFVWGKTRNRLRQYTFESLNVNLWHRTVLKKRNLSVSTSSIAFPVQKNCIKVITWTTPIICINLISWTMTFSSSALSYGRSQRLKLLTFHNLSLGSKVTSWSHMFTSHFQNCLCIRGKKLYQLFQSSNVILLKL